MLSLPRFWTLHLCCESRLVAALSGLTCAPSGVHTARGGVRASSVFTAGFDFALTAAAAALLADAAPALLAAQHVAAAANRVGDLCGTATRTVPAITEAVATGLEQCSALLRALQAGAADRARSESDGGVVGKSEGAKAEPTEGCVAAARQLRRWRWRNTGGAVGTAPPELSMAVLLKGLGNA